MVLTLARFLGLSWNGMGACHSRKLLAHIGCLCLCAFSFLLLECYNCQTGGVAEESEHPQLEAQGGAEQDLHRDESLGA